MKRFQAEMARALAYKLAKLLRFARFDFCKAPKTFSSSIVTRASGFSRIRFSSSAPG